MRDADSDRRSPAPEQSRRLPDRFVPWSAGTAVIENPISGEKIVIRPGAAATRDSLLVWELFLGPGGRVPSSHKHPEQEERFTVLDGVMRFRVRGRVRIVRAGESLSIPAGTVHSFANAGPDPAHVAVETRPALRMQALLETAAALAREQHAARRMLPHAIDVALFMCEFDREVGAPYLPAFLVGPLTRLLAALARARGWDRRYQHLRVAG